MAMKWSATPLLTTSYDSNGDALAAGGGGKGGGGSGNGGSGSKSTAVVSGLSRPMRLTVDNNHQGLLYIADSGNHRVLEVEVDSGRGSSSGSENKSQGQGQGKTVVGKVTQCNLGSPYHLPSLIDHRSNSSLIRLLYPTCINYAPCTDAPTLSLNHPSSLLFAYPLSVSTNKVWR